MACSSMPAWIATTSSGDRGLVISTPSTTAAKHGPIWRVLMVMAAASRAPDSSPAESGRRLLPLEPSWLLYHRIDEPIREGSPRSQASALRADQRPAAEDRRVTDGAVRRRPLP